MIRLVLAPGPAKASFQSLAVSKLICTFVMTHLPVMGPYLGKNAKEVGVL